MVSPCHPPRPFLSAATGGFALPTVSQRMPRIVADCIADCPALRAPLSALIDDLADATRPLRPIADDADGDAVQWNAALNDFFPGATFHTASWLFVECYMYRRIREAQLHAGHPDPFRARKQNVVVEHRERVARILADRDDPHDDDLRQLLTASLWGNAVDLSLAAGMAADDRHALLHGPNGGIVVDDRDSVCDYIRGRMARGAVVDIVLDNSGTSGLRSPRAILRDLTVLLSQGWSCCAICVWPTT